ncbi:hypothetical protein chiPu_0023606 [Chiloscyllium punctatum]|uniref:Uncharacterized protein n=1 Tax=Chiloscyllium punctatum TaxID=137246 RepID=A0A401TAA1_CHIPU|nr:hypothetical protein [Chiloscyllium punctatum]
MAPPHRCLGNRHLPVSRAPIGQRQGAWKEGDARTPPWWGRDLGADPAHDDCPDAQRHGFNPLKAGGGACC